MKVFYSCVQKIAMQKRLEDQAICSNINGSIRPPEEGPWFSYSALSQSVPRPQMHLVPGCGELPALTEELSGRNIFHHSFPARLGQCTRHSVT